jgi:hypothetical protein
VDRLEILESARRRRLTGNHLSVKDDPENAAGTGVDERVKRGEAAPVASAAETFELSRLHSPGCDGLLVLLPTGDDPLVHVGSYNVRFLNGSWRTLSPTRRRPYDSQR